MGKFVFIFLTIFIVALASSHAHQEIPTHYVEEVQVPYGHVVHVEPEEDYTEIYVAIANSAYDFFAKFVQSKVDLLLWIKQALLKMIVNAIIYIKHNGNELDGIVHTAYEVMKVFRDLHVPVALAPVALPHGEYGAPH